MTYVLSIAGSDSSGLAGIQADVKTFADYKVESATVMTCITAQNSSGVRAILPLSPKMVIDQLDAVFEELPIQAVKIGVLCSSSIICAIAERLSFYRPTFVVLDPVIFSSSGYRFLSDTALLLLKQKLFPLATLLTPNLEEAYFLVQNSKNDLFTMGKRLLQLGPNAVLIKGGHHEKEKGCDYLFTKSSASISFKKKTIKGGKKVRGTGCRLSSAITACLAKKYPLHKAIANGKSYVYRFLQR